MKSMDAGGPYGSPERGGQRAAAWLVGPEVPAVGHATLLEALRNAAEGPRGGEPLLHFHLGRRSGARSARELVAAAGRWAGALRAAGVGQGEAVPILLPTGPAFVEAFFGVLWAGGVPAPLSSPMTFGGVERYVANLARVVLDSGARCLVASGRMADAAAVEPSLAGSVRAIVRPEEVEAASPVEPATVGPGETALLQYTSGTTATPKGVRISHRALVANAAAIASGLELGPDDVGVSWLPMFHDMGLIGVLLTQVCHPYPLHLMRPESFVMQPGRWLELASEVGATLTAAPNFAYALATGRRGRVAEETRLGSLRRALNGSEPVHASTVRAFEDRFAAHGLAPHVSMPVYGLAEATLAVTFTRPGEPLRVLRLDRGRLQAEGRAVDAADGAPSTEVVSVGRPVAGVQVRVRSERGGVASEREVGEIEVRGPSVMDGYHGRPDATAEALVDGWLRTGDLGFVDGGELFVVGRRKEMVIKGGRNIYPYDVERIASDLTGYGAAAFGRTDPQSGTEALVLVVEARASDPEAREALQKRIAGEVLSVLGAKVDEVHLWPVGSLPRTTSGKVRRQACAERLAEQAGAAEGS